jgi:hypothetical protein
MVIFSFLSINGNHHRPLSGGEFWLRFQWEVIMLWYRNPRSCTARTYISSRIFRTSSIIWQKYIQKWRTDGTISAMAFDCCRTGMEIWVENEKLSIVAATMSLFFFEIHKRCICFIIGTVDDSQCLANSVNHRIPKWCPLDEECHVIISNAWLLIISWNVLKECSSRYIFYNTLSWIFIVLSHWNNSPWAACRSTWRMSSYYTEMELTRFLVHYLQEAQSWPNHHLIEN